MNFETSMLTVKPNNNNSDGVGCEVTQLLFD